MARVVNYSKLRPSIQRKLRKAGYKPDPGGKTASRKSKKRRGGKIAEAQDKAARIAKENAAAIKARGKIAADKARKKEQARKTPMKIKATSKAPTAAWTPNAAGMPVGLGAGAGAPSQKAGGWKNVYEVLKTSLTPWSKDKVAVSPSVTGALPRAALKTLANRPFSSALAVTGVAGLARGITTSVAKMFSKTAVKQASKIGTKGLVQLNLKGKGASTAATIATNSKNTKITTAWLTKLAKATTNPVLVVSGVMAAIGTYPFAGFIKEEALQTTGFAVKSALDNNDFEGAEAALDHQREMLDPDMWDKIKAGIPFVNVLANLDEFYEAAKIKVAVDEKIISDLKQQQETGESDDDRWERIRQEQAAEEQQNIDYYNNERRKLIDWENAARAAAAAATRAADIKARNEDAAFWAKEQARQRELEAKDREAQAEFWMAYRKSMQKQSDESRPSQLNFGLL